MRNIKLFMLFLSLLLVNTTFAQKKDFKEEAAYYFDLKDYKKSYDLYDKLNAESPKNLEYKFRLGFSSIHYPEKKARAIEVFEDLKKNDKSDDILYYLGKAYHINYKFDQAIEYYNQFISKKGDKLKGDYKLFFEDSKLGVINCTNGKTLIEKKVFADIKNMGSPLNTNEEEYVPVISTDESILIYTYVGKNVTGGKVNEALKADREDGYYHEDIYISKKINDTTFSAGYNISNSINTKGHDAAIALSPDGTTLFTYNSSQLDNGDIYTSTLTGDVWSKPERLNANINTPEWEGSCSISSDSRFLYFASERLGGLGGRDLYVSEKINGDWGPAQNLGPAINTPYNEDAPFIHPDGITLFFSSEGHKSIGGYDIMYSIKQENKWIEPLSMGIPLNTTEDDRYYVINAKGNVGYFSSNRGGAGGKGGQDIYTVTPGILGEKPVLALLRGSVFIDDKPSAAKIEVMKKSTNEAIGPYYANSKTGKYLMALAPGNGYKIKIVVSVSGYEPIEEEVDIEKLQRFVEIKKDFYVYSPSYANKKEQQSVKSILDSLINSGTNAESFNADLVLNNIANPQVDDIKKTSASESKDLVSELENIEINEPTNANKQQKVKVVASEVIVNNVASNLEKSESDDSKFVQADKKANTKINNEQITAESSVSESKPERTKTIPCNEFKIGDLSSLKGKSLNDVNNYKLLLKLAGDACVKDLVFKVQIAAYRKPENYNYSKLQEFGKPEIVTYPDGIVRFTQLQFSTLKEAEVARKKIINKGQTDAWITAFVNGKRYTLEELILANFLLEPVN